MDIKRSRKSLSFTHERLTLYYHPFSFYSQKVLFAFYEKNIECDLEEVDISTGTQCSNWFLQLNPKFDVPVLQNGSLVIPSSNQIISYLEENFDEDDIQKLIPKNLGRREIAKILSLHRAISRLPIGAISLGSFIHNDVVKRPKLPFVGPLRRGFLDGEKEIAAILKKYAEENKLYRATLEQKAKDHQNSIEKLKNRDIFLSLLTRIDSMFDELENELQNQKESDWLCSNQFTIADISLGVLMHRLQILGLGHRFWSNGKRPCLEKYFSKLQSRPAFKKSLPSSLSMLKIIWKKTPLDVKVIISAAVVITGIVAYRL